MTCQQHSFPRNVLYVSVVVAGVLWWEIEFLSTAWEHGHGWNDKSHAENYWFLMLINIFVCFAEDHRFFFEKCRHFQWNKKAQLMIPLMSVKIVIVRGFSTQFREALCRFSQRNRFSLRHRLKDLRIARGALKSFTSFCWLIELQVLRIVYLHHAN